MEGLKLIAQSTFDRHQKFRAGPGPGAPPPGECGPYRYNVIEIGAFAGTAPSSSSKPNSASGAGSNSKQNGGGSAAGSPSRVTLNEWMVHEDDLGAFMKKRPVHVVSSPPSAEAQQQQQQSASPQDAHHRGGGGGGGGTATTGSTGLSRSGSSRGAGSGTSMGTNTTNTTTTAATTTATGASGSGSTRRANTKEEIEAVASLKLICIQRAGADPDGGGAGTDTDNHNTLAISREVFLRLYVDLMDGDHCALYYLARDYDGFHEFSDSSRGVATKFLGTSDYALLWTFNRRTMETRGVFLDRCQRWQAKDAGAAAAAPATTTEPGTAPATPATPSRKWTQNRSGSSTVTASEAWQVFRETLHTYRTYVFAPQLLTFTACVHMLRTFDDQVSGSDLPLLKEAEASVAAVLADGGGGGGGRGLGGAPDYDNDGETGRVVGGSLLPSTQTSSFVIGPERNSFAPSTPPNEAEKMYHYYHHRKSPPTRRTAADSATAAAAAAADRHRLLSHALACGRVDSSLSNKLRHLRTVRTTLEGLSREHETVVADVVPAEFLDRYHRSMEGMTEAVPALERHVASLEEYLRYLKGRSEKLGGGSALLPLVRPCCHTLACAAVAAAAPPAPPSVDASTTTTACPPSCSCSSSSNVAHKSDSLSLRCHEADSRSGPVVFGRRPVARPDGGGTVGLGISVGRPGSSAGSDEGEERATRRSGRREADGRGRNLGFYAGYLLRGNYSHRLR